jgi:CDP-glucose 4,6-dehydratase
MIRSEFWHGKKVLLTGHTGFKGSWLSIWLQNLGTDVCGLSLAPGTNPSLFELARASDGMRSHIEDIRDFGAVSKICQDFSPEIIIHMAAQPLVRKSYLDPIETYSTNVMGTVNILEAARACKTVKAIVCITTDKCYENKEWTWGYRETEAMGGHDPYSSSKGCAELICGAYRRSFLQENGVLLATARAGNVIGGGDWSDDRLVPDILRALEADQTLKVRNPNSIRPWQHVLEPLSGYLMLAQKLYEGDHNATGAWNFGPWEQDAKDVDFICKEFFNHWGGGRTFKRQHGDHPHEATYLKLDISKARNELNWEPKWRISYAIKQIVSWHRGYLSNVNLRKLCELQIREYCT